MRVTLREGAAHFLWTGCMTRSARIETAAYWIGLVLIGWALVSFLFVPLGTALVTAFVRDGSIALGEITGELAGSRRVRQAIWNTVWMTAATTVTVTIVGVFQVMVLEYFHSPRPGDPQGRLRHPACLRLHRRGGGLQFHLWPLGCADRGAAAAGGRTCPRTGSTAGTGCCSSTRC